MAVLVFQMLIVLVACTVPLYFFYSHTRFLVVVDDWCTEETKKLLQQKRSENTFHMINSEVKD